MTTIQMPQLGETIVEGTILKWLKNEGESVQRDEPLFEISTDKVDTEVPSPVAGTVAKLLVAEGATVPVGTDVMEIDDGSAPSGATAAPGSPPAEAPAVDAAPSSPARPNAAPAVAQAVATPEPAAPAVPTPSRQLRLRRSRCPIEVRGRRSCRRSSVASLASEGSTSPR